MRHVGNQKIGNVRAAARSNVKMRLWISGIESGGGQLAARPEAFRAGQQRRPQVGAPVSAAEVRIMDNAPGGGAEAKHLAGVSQAEAPLTLTDDLDQVPFRQQRRAQNALVPGGPRPVRPGCRVSDRNAAGQGKRD